MHCTTSLRKEGHILTPTTRIRRFIDRYLAQHDTITSDIARQWAERKKITIHPNAWGAIFQRSGLAALETLPSLRPEARGRRVTVWTSVRS